MENFEVIIHLELFDKKTGELWRTPNHHPNKHLDDYHKPGGIKDDIKAQIGKKLKDKIGDNFDVHINDGKIIIVSQRIDTQTGKRIKKSHNTDIDADGYFEKIIKLILITIIEEAPLEFIRVIIERKEFATSTTWVYYLDSFKKLKYNI